MRRKDREINEISEILEIIRKCDSCSVALFNEEYPYVIPMNFGFEHENGVLSLFFHSAEIGKKLDLIRKNGNAAFEMSCSHRLITGKSACSFTMEYESVCGNGHMEILEDKYKVKALNLLMSQYTNEQSYNFEESALKKVIVMRLIIKEIHAKCSKRK